MLFIVSIFIAAVMAGPAMLAPRQGISAPAGLPTCAMGCFTASMGPSSTLACGVAVKCYCGLDAFQSAIKTCAPGKCAKTDLAKTYSMANSMCDGAKGYSPLVAPA